MVCMNFGFYKGTLKYLELNQIMLSIEYVAGLRGLRSIALLYLSNRF